MRCLLFPAVVAAVCGLTISAFALPGLPETGQTATEASPVNEARLFCYNCYSGRFKYWGPCRSSVPRVF